MHTYATDQEERQRIVVVILAMISLLMSLGLALLFRQLTFAVPFWIDTPAIFGFFGILWGAYDRWIWRWAVRGRTFSGIPDLSGYYLGQIEVDQGFHGEARVTIKQTASRISILLTTERSSSHSFFAALRLEEGLQQGLHFGYEFRPARGIDAPVQPHWGTTHFTSISKGVLSGWWVAEWGGGTLGRLVVEKASTLEADRGIN